MRKWTWLLFAVSAGSVAFACGGDDDGGSNDNTGGAGGTTATTDSGGSGGSDAGGSGGSSGGSGGSGGSSPNTTTGADGGSGGTSTTGSGGNAGMAGETSDAGGMAGMAGETSTGDGTTGGEPPTMEELCAASCAAQESAECPDAACEGICNDNVVYTPNCEAEYRAQAECYAGLEGDEFACDYGFPSAALDSECADEDYNVLICIVGG